MQGLKRKIVYVSLYELIGLAITTSVVALMGGATLDRGGALAVMTATTAAVINILFNYGFEAFERWSGQTSRPLRWRLLHAAGFQLSMLVVLVPIIAWWLDVSWLRALAMEAVLSMFFPIHTFLFTWLFDTVFGLPQAVGAKGTAA